MSSFENDTSIFTSSSSSVVGEGV